MKQRNASSGVQTIGSPRTLNEVFDEHRAAGRGLEGGEQAANKAGLVSAVHRLHARGIIDMRHRRNFGALHVELVDAEELLLVAVIARRRDRSTTSATSSM